MVIGVAAAVVAWVGMAGWAMLGVSLIGLGAGATPAALAVSIGGSARLSEDRLDGTISVLPLGASLVGAMLLATLLTTWWRVLGAAVTFLAGVAVLPLIPAGDLEIDAGRTWLGGTVWLVVVLGVRIAMWWYQWVRAVTVVLLGVSGLAVVLGALVSIAGGARVLGTMLLGAPNLLAIALTRGLGVPWTVHGPPVPLPTIDSGGLAPLAAPSLPLAVLAAAVVLAIAVFARWHAAWVCGVLFAGMALGGGASVDLRAGAMFAIEIGASGDALVAAGAGLAAGLVASLLVAGVRYWQGRRT